MGLFVEELFCFVWIEMLAARVEKTPLPIVPKFLMSMYIARGRYLRRYFRGDYFHAGCFHTGSTPSSGIYSCRFDRHRPYPYASDSGSRRYSSRS